MDWFPGQPLRPATKPSGTGHWIRTLARHIIRIHFKDATYRLHIVGRYRNAGDSTTGLGKGARGLELAIFTSTEHGRSFTRTVSLTKADLSRTPGDVVSIEGAALNATPAGGECYVSTEKATRRYPHELASFQKPGTGVWTIDVMTARAVAELADADVLSLGTDLTGAPEPIQMVFYDGAECLRSHEENAAAVSRPRGCSCEELGGLAVTTGDRFDRILKD